MESIGSAVAPRAAGGLETYVCPACKNRLDHREGALSCGACSQTYPVSDRIPDFVREELSQSEDAQLRRMTAIDRMARVYETKLWYPLVLTVHGGFQSPSLAQLIEKVTRSLRSVQGRVLDVACGPGTYGRRVASPSLEVFGIDVSKRMLRQGAAYAAQEGIDNVHFARARVEVLPFDDGFFDGVVCCGSLHLFADTAVALGEMARVMKPGAILSVFTFTAGKSGILKYRRVREWSLQRHGLHVFELPGIESLLAASGFERFEAEVAGSILTFTASRRAE